MSIVGEKVMMGNLGTEAEGKFIAQTDRDYTDVKSNPSIVTSVCRYMTSWQRSKEITIDSLSTGRF